MICADNLSDNFVKSVRKPKNFGKGLSPYVLMLRLFPLWQYCDKAHYAQSISWLICWQSCHNYVQSLGAIPYNGYSQSDNTVTHQITIKNVFDSSVDQLVRTTYNNRGNFHSDITETNPITPRRFLTNTVSDVYFDNLVTHHNTPKKCVTNILTKLSQLIAKYKGLERLYSNKYSKKYIRILRKFKINSTETDISVHTLK